MDKNKDYIIPIKRLREEELKLEERRKKAEAWLESTKIIRRVIYYTLVTLLMVFLLLWAINFFIHSLINWIAFYQQRY